MKRKRHLKLFTKSRESMRLAVVIAGIALSDLVIKESIDEEPSEDFPRAMPHTGGNIVIHKKRNPGFALGFLKERQDIVKLIPVIVTAVLFGRLQAMAAEKGRFLEKTGLAISLGGAVSNLVDRFRKGYVVDYICIQKGVLKKIIVNIGDIAIAVGAAVMAAGSLISFFKSGKKRRVS